MKTFHEFDQYYKDLDISTSNMGAVMADLDPKNIQKILDVIDDSDCYTDPKLPFVQGKVGAKPHMTVKYGILKGVKTEFIEAIYKGEDLGSVDCKAISCFSNAKDVYDVLILKVDPTGNIKKLNELAAFAPNVDTFVPYVPHVTLAYLKKGKLKDYKDLMDGKWNIKMKVTELNYSPYGVKESFKLKI